MNKFSALGLAAIFALTIAPSFAASTSMKTMPTCKGRMVVANTKTKMYMVATSGHVTGKNKMLMCEAAAKAKGYHMMVVSPAMSPAGYHGGGAPAQHPMVNPSGNLNADPGASPNPMNDQNGIHTTVAPNPTPTP